MKKKICMILVAVLVAVLGTSTYFIIDHYKESNKQAALYGELAELVDAAAQTDAATEPAEQIPYSEEKMLLPELAELFGQNGDLVGWISIADTNINYPVVQTNNNSKYLNTLFDGTANASGAIFLDSNDTAPGVVDQQTTIYGHHMNDGSMFNVISDTTDQATFDSIEFVYYITRDATYKLRPLATKVVEDTYAKARTTNFEGDDGLKNYLSEMLDGASAVASDAIDRAASATKVVTLVTCRSLSLSNTRAVMVLTPVEE